MEIGKDIIEKKGDSIIFESLLDTENLAKVGHLIEIDINDGEYTGKIYHSEFSLDDKAKANSILYKKGPSNGADYSPTTRLTNSSKSFDYDKFYKKFLHYFKDIPKWLTDTDKEFFKCLKNTLTNNEKAIIDDIDRAIKENGVLDSKEKNCVVSLRIDGKSVSEFEMFKKQLHKLIQDSAKKFDNKNVIGKNRMCCLTHEISDEVYGNANNFSFMTWDKWSFISGGFNKKEVWKNYPVSPDAYTFTEIGKRKVMQNLIYYFCGFQYAVIPKLTNSSDKIKLVDVVEDLSRGNENEKDVYINKDNLYRLTRKEDRVFRKIEKEDNRLLFDFMFYEASNNAFRILLYIDDIRPSLIKTLYKAQKEIQSYPMFHYVRDKEITYNKGKSNEYIYQAIFTFDAVRSFFYNRKDRGNFDKTFLELTGKIFNLRKIGYDLLLDRFVKDIQYNFRNGYGLLIPVTNAFLILYFLNHLKILNRIRKRKGEDMKYYNDEDLGYTSDDDSKRDVGKEFAEFFNQHSDFYDTPEKVTAFLVGVLSQKLLNIQNIGRENKPPFLNRLNGLKLRENILKRIFTEAKNKLLEYNKSYYKRLEALISRYSADCGDFSRITNNELSFYFASGMSLAGLFIKYEKIKKEELSS